MSTTAAVSASAALCQDRARGQQQGRRGHAKDADPEVSSRSHDKFSLGICCESLLGLSQAGVLETVYLLYPQERFKV